MVGYKALSPNFSWPEYYKLNLSFVFEIAREPISTSGGTTRGGGGCTNHNHQGSANHNVEGSLETTNKNNEFFCEDLIEDRAGRNRFSDSFSV